MTKHYSRSIELLCPTCASSAFEFDDQLAEDCRVYTCQGCKIVVSNDDLMTANSSRIDAEVSTIEDELVGDMVKRLRKSFSGNKYVKFK